MVPQSESHVAKVIETLRLHKDTFLEHAEPDVALLVLDDALHLAFRQIGLVAEVRIAIGDSLYRIVNGDTFAVATNEETVVSADVDGVDGEVANVVYLGEYRRTRCHLIDTLAFGGKIQLAVSVFFDVMSLDAFCSCDMCRENAFLVEAIKFLFFCDNPDSSFLVLKKLVDVGDFVGGCLKRCEFLFS